MRSLTGFITATIARKGKFLKFLIFWYTRSMEEIEVKFLDIDVSVIEAKLIAIGATKVGETLSRISCFDYPNYRLRDTDAWIRLRTEFDKTALTYKQRLGATSHDGSTSDTGMKEVEVEVSDFDKAKEFLFSIGLIEKFAEERKRVRFEKDGIEIDIDTWPLLSPYLELEGNSWEALQALATLLGLPWESHMKCSAMQVYALNGIDENSYSVLTFDKQIKK